MNLKKIEFIRSSKSPFKMWDIVVFAVAFTLIIALTFSIFSSRGERVTITMEGAIKTYKLSENREIPLDGKLIVVINGGEVFVKDSTCKNKICEHMGKIKYVNQSITCTQNKIAIKIIGDKGDIAGSVG